MEHLKVHDIQAGIHYPLPVHLQPAYKNRIRTAVNMSITERLAEEVLSLPMYPELLLADVVRITETINGYLTKNAST